MIIAARLLGQTDFGQLTMVTNTMGYLGIFAGLGLGTTATKYVAEWRSADPARAGRILTLTNLGVAVSAAVMAGGLIIAAPWLAGSLLNAPELAGGIQLGALLLVANEVNSVQISALAGLEMFRAIATINFLRGVITVPLITLATWQAGIAGAILAFGLVAVVTCIYSQVMLQKGQRQFGIPHARVSAAWTEKRILWHFAVPAFLSGMLVGPVMWLGNALLVNQADGYAELGVFNAANQWRNAMMFIPSVLATAMLPILSSLSGGNDHKNTRKVLLSMMLVSGGIALVAAVVLVLGRNLIMALYGETFVRQADILIVISVTFVLIAIQTPVGQAIAAAGRMWVGMLMNLGWALVFTLAGVVLIGNYELGAMGLALTYLISYTVHSVWTGWYVLRMVSPAPSDSLEQD